MGTDRGGLPCALSHSAPVSLQSAYFSFISLLQHKRQTQPQSPFGWWVVSPSSRSRSTARAPTTSFSIPVPITALCSARFSPSSQFHWSVRVLSLLQRTVAFTSARRPSRALALLALLFRSWTFTPLTPGYSAPTINTFRAFLVKSSLSTSTYFS